MRSSYTEYDVYYSIQWGLTLEICYCCVHIPRLSLLQEVIACIHDDALQLPDSLLADYPALVHIRVKANVAAYKSACRSLLGCVVKLLKSRRVGGVHTVIDASHPRLLTGYAKLGFVDVTPDDVIQKDLMVLGKRI